MSKDAYVESDSPISRHDLSDVKDDINIDKPLSGHSSYEIINDRSEHNEDVVSFKYRNGKRKVEIHTTLHKTFPPPVHSDTLSFDRPVYETPGLKNCGFKNCGLVHQPNRWGAELHRATGLNTGGCKASLVTPLPSTSRPPVPSSCLNGIGMELLSEACAAMICHQHA